MYLGSRFHSTAWIAIISLGLASRICPPFATSCWRSGPVSSLFDFLTFFVMLEVFHAGMDVARHDQLQNSLARSYAAGSSM